MNTSRPRNILVVLVAMAGLAACGGQDEPASTADPSASDTPAAPSDSSSTLALTADASAAGKCAAPNAATLASFDTAFSGTVTALGDGTATLSVDTWYAGDEAATVTVATPNKDLQDLLMAVDFQEGKSYLVSATGGRVTLCGFTAEENPDLQAIYDEAFPG